MSCRAEWSNKFFAVAPGLSNCIQGCESPTRNSEEPKIYCPYCRTAGKLYFPFNTRTYYHCPSCDLIFQRRKEDIKTVVTYYQNLYFDDYTEDQISGQRSSIYRHILDFLGNYKKPGALLDLGCGCGFFLKAAAERGWQVSRVDPSQKSIEYARSLVGDTVLCGTLDDISTDRIFDAFTLINVLDHMVDPCRQLQKIKDLLVPDGILYLRFPNGSFHSFLMRLSLKFSSGQFMNSFLIFHEYAITSRFIRRCLEDTGFANIRISNAHLTGGNFCPTGWTFAKLTMKILSSLIWGFFKALEKLSGGRWLWGPSLQVIARKGTWNASKT